MFFLCIYPQFCTKKSHFMQKREIIALENLLFRGNPNSIWLKQAFLGYYGLRKIKHVES